MAKQQKPLIGEYEIKSTSETRAELTKILANFRLQGKKTLPILFGSHRKPEAVLVPIALWKKIVKEIDDLQLALTVSERLRSPQQSEPMSFEQYLAEADEIISRHKDSIDADGHKNIGLR
jgi:PHD/YefM family antitoxin component YafN of YafNO toxin-antitoxin module